VKGRDHLVNLSIDERIILKWMVKKQDGSVWTGFIRLRKKIIGGLL
jgi:hypothetical protein